MSKASNWMRNSVFGLLAFAFIFWAIAGAWVFSWYVDSKPPIRQISSTASAAYPGELMHVSVAVERDLERECRGEWARRMIDSRGSVIWAQSAQPVNSINIAAMESRTPGESNFDVRVPYGALPGDLIVETPLKYWCNPWQTFRGPIEVTLTATGKVLGP